jgi:hypothetical protein
MILSEAQEALCDKLNINFAKIAQNALFSAADLIDHIQAGAQEAWAYKPWTFTLDALDTTWTDEAYLDYPNRFEDQSIFLLTVNEEEWEPKNFMDFKRWQAQNPDANDEYWATFKRLYFVNTNALTSGDTISVYGKLRCPLLSLAADKLPFSPENDNDETSGNKAIVILAYADALASDKKKNPGQAEIERKKAFGMLDTLWKPMPERTSKDQHLDRPFFTDVPDFFRGSGTGRSTNIGNFP